MSANGDGSTVSPQAVPNTSTRVVRMTWALPDTDRTVAANRDAPSTRTGTTPMKYFGAGGIPNTNADSANGTIVPTSTVTRSGRRHGPDRANPIAVAATTMPAPPRSSAGSAVLDSPTVRPVRACITDPGPIPRERPAG